MYLQAIKILFSIFVFRWYIICKSYKYNAIRSWPNVAALYAQCVCGTAEHVLWKRKNIAHLCSVKSVLKIIAKPNLISDKKNELPMLLIRRLPGLIYINRYTIYTVVTLIVVVIYFLFRWNLLCSNLQIWHHINNVVSYVSKISAN